MSLSPLFPAAVPATTNLKPLHPCKQQQVQQSPQRLNNESELHKHLEQLREFKAETTSCYLENAAALTNEGWRKHDGQHGNERVSF